jgi:tetratricopeptide (TPR) repeat protein
MRPRSIVRTVARTLAVTFVAALTLPAPAGAADFATVEAVAGQVVVVRAGQTQAATSGTALQLDDIVVTKQGRASVRFASDGTVLRIGPESRVQLNESAAQRDVTVFFGRLWAHVVRWRERPTRFATAGTIAAVRGTELSMAVETDGDRTQLAVFEGLVHAQNDAGALDVAGGQTATARKGVAPAHGVAVHPKDAVAWALYYLPVVYAKPGELGEGSPWQTKAKESQEAYAKGDLEKAISSLEGVDDKGIRESKFFAYRASLFLATGNVGEAEKDLDRALKLKENDANALALQSIVAVARNEPDKALTLAKRAVTADPKSATPLIAQSYAEQARFDLPAARASLDKAVGLDEKDALAWARLAEIRSSQGNLEGALAAARKAAELAPGLSRAQTVLGYAYLTEVKTAEAKAAFDEAIKLDQSDPLPRLGLGLARIRDGHLAEGSKEIEVATSLDPNQSLLRSYLGKAYFEAKRENLVGREYELAKKADPKDPTPYLYDAIDKQTTNRPVDALEDVQKAIELNDNRAVYRSRLLLDADLAARSASLGRIYNDLGFQDLGLVEGWNSVNTDPSDFSGHRLLADNYASQPRHEIARVSELFQSQMLQPINTTPIQPRLGESNLHLIANGGPASLSFNEFNPLFNRNQVTGQGSFLVAENSTVTGEAIAAGIFDKFSFSAGYSGYTTDGWRDNADQTDHIANAFVQVEASPSTSLQAEYRYRNNEYGDLRYRFFSDDFAPEERNKEERNTARVGARHTFSPGSVLLASFMYQDARVSLIDTNPGFPLTYLSLTGPPQKAYGLEAQYLFRSPRVNVEAGVGYFNVNAELDTKYTLDPEIAPPPDNTVEQTVSQDLKHTNLYAYAHIKPHKQFTVIAGASADFLNGDSPDVGKDNQFNPKVGIIWKPAGGTTVRGTAFRAVKRTLITDQTLEPTQVAGFNQFYDDLNGTRVWNYGGAIDQKFTKRVFGGAEYAKRDLDFGTVTTSGEPNSRGKADEHSFRAYLLGAPHPWLALRADYLFEHYDSKDLILLPSSVDTHRLPLGVSFFHPSGFAANVTATYVDQKGDFVKISGEPQSGSDNFWTVDASVTYRLPKRYGFLSVGASNLFNEEFNYYDMDLRNPTVQPTRRVYGRLTLAF